VDNELDIIGFIPARFGSTRLPGKPLLEINGKPLLQIVYENICQSSMLRRLIVLTDHEKIAELCEWNGMEYLMTPSDLPSGTDRICYALQELDEKPDLVVNIQGDEPMLDAETIDDLINRFSGSHCYLGTLIKRIYNEDELFANSSVKVVLDNFGQALYFSRNPIPYLRDIEKEKWLDNHIFWKHIGVYIYRYHSITSFPDLTYSNLENSEKLEQLRFLQDGFKVQCVETSKTFYGIDTAEDYEFVKKIFAEKNV
jgi:3-deoxy-manno-octulosonate cytidylyltransferase (CMP-KDO synthetase)